MEKQNKEQTQDTNIALEVKSFSKRYRGRKDFAVKDASFVVQAGEFHGFIGANGAGKTTTIKSLIGAYAQWEGDIRIFGNKNTSIAAKRRMGYIPEAANFPKTLNALDYITHMANLAGIPFKEAKKFAKATLTDIGLGPVMKKKPNTFSSGQKKKVLLAQALVNNPDVLIMDEPAANLDPQARSEFFTELKKLQKQGKAILISSHILAELDTFVDSVTILDGGKVVYTGQTAELSSNIALAYHFTFRDKESKEKFEKYLDKQKITHKREETLMIKAKMLTEENIDKALAYIVKNKLALESMNSNRQTLQQAYDKYVKHGSVDTKGQDTKNRRAGA